MKARELRASGAPLLGRVRYFIYYKVENGTLHVLALWHASREHQPVL
jgi:hypothetical protein